MIVVNATLVPGGDLNSKRIETLCSVSIVNDGTGTATRRNYTVTLFSRGKKPRKLRERKIENFPSKSVPAWRLIAEAFKVLDLD